MFSTPNKTEWVKFGKVHILAFVGKDVICIAGGCHLQFINLNTHEEIIYRANNNEFGEGVSCLAGHKTSYVFAFAEKCCNPKILVQTYPEFNRITTMIDGSAEGYTSIAFSESDFLITLGSLPFFAITVWNWRNGDKMARKTTDIFDENQVLKCNYGSPVIFAQLGPENNKLNVWDISMCGKKCVLTQHEVKTHVDFGCFTASLWTTEGALLVLDVFGNVYTTNSDYKLESIIQWEEPGTHTTSFTWFKAGLLISGPNGHIKHYKKSGNWACDWSVLPEVSMAKITAGLKDLLVSISEHGDVMQFDITSNSFKYIKQYESSVDDFCLVYPAGEVIVTLTHHDRLSAWEIESGNMADTMILKGKALAIAENPEYPYIGIGYDHGVLELISVYAPRTLKSMASFNLTKNPLSSVYFTQIGKLIVTADLATGQFFIIEGIPGSKMNVIATIEAHHQILDYILVPSKTCLRLFSIYQTSQEYMAGNRIVRHCIIKGNPHADEKDYHIQDNSILFSKLYATTRSNRDRIFYAITLNSKQVQEIETKRAKDTANIINTILTGHQLRKILLHIDDHHFISFGYDGLIITRSADLRHVFGVIMPHHRRDGGISKAYIDPLSRYIVSLGRDNVLTCTALLNTEIDLNKQALLQELVCSSKFELMFTRKTTGFVPKDKLESKTWLEVQKIKEEEMEYQQCLEQRNNILKEFQEIQAEVRNLLTENIEGPDDEKLDVIMFNMDEELMSEKVLKSKEICKQTHDYLEALIVAQDKVSMWIKEHFWNSMSVQGKMLCAIFANFSVENYTLLPVEMQNELAQVKEVRRIETMVGEEDSFHPWLPKTHSELHLQLACRPKLAEEEPAYNIKRSLSLEEEPELPDIETITAFAGSIVNTFIELNSGHYMQQELQSFQQANFQATLSRDEKHKLKEFFNKMFEDMISQKVREMAHVLEKNARLRHILSELNYFSISKYDIIIDDPEWEQVENPELLLKVESKEVGITPYISPSEQAILDEKAAEAERIRLALLADDFRERALMAMMNGVLEIRWEDELRKDVLVPKCMKDKQPEEFNEEDLRAVRDYEEKVKFLNSERERYKGMLNAEYAKLGNSLREGIKKFNNRLAEFLLLKIKIDSSIQQESFRINRIRLKNHKRIMLSEKEQELTKMLGNNDQNMHAIHQLIASLSESLAECRSHYDALQTKDRLLDKNFKRDFMEASPVVQEQALKLYKKRPKANVRNLTSTTIMVDVGKCVVTHERSLILNQECLEFLRAMDNLDLYVGVTNAVDEHAYSIICKHRRLKIENEYKVKAASMEMTEAENTIASFHKILSQKKEFSQKLLRDLEEIRHEKVKQCQNIELQIVLRQGLVEVPTTGQICDFNDSIMVSRQEVEYINKIILQSGNRKLKAMKDTMTFRRGILGMEWEHKRMRMQIADLHNKLADVESIKVTQEIQSYLKSKARGSSPDKSLSFEEEVQLIKQSYERIIEERKHKVSELQQQINVIKKETKILDKKIADINVDVCEYKLDRDVDMEKKEKDIIRIRMITLLKRANLVKQIQANHNELLVLQTELELLRLKTFPTLKYKILS